MKQRLDQAFFARETCEVAVDLLGKRLVRRVNGHRVSGLIVETEAYCAGDEPDLACHAHRANKGRPTARTAVMFGPAGVAYVYFSYGLHWMFNVVTGETGAAGAVLIRALVPDEGEGVMQAQRNGRPRAEWTNGPAKLAQALLIDKSLNGTNLCDLNGVIWIEDGLSVKSGAVCTGPRIGLGQTPEPWFSMPWRYWVCGHAFVSK